MARELEIPRLELDEMSPREFKKAWDDRNQRLKVAGVFARIDELHEKHGEEVWTIYLTRTQQMPFWTRPWPSLPLVSATEAAQAAATVFAATGIFMTPIGWKLAALVWGYAIAWFLVNDRLKVHGYRLIAQWRAWETENQPTRPDALSSHGSSP